MWHYTFITEKTHSPRPHSLALPRPSQEYGGGCAHRLGASAEELLLAELVRRNNGAPGPFPLLEEQGGEGAGEGAGREYAGAGRLFQESIRRSGTGSEVD